MINTERATALVDPGAMIGALMDTEALLLSSVEGKRVLRPLLLPANMDEPNELIECLWEAGLHSAWVMPGSGLSRRATSAWFEQLRGRWVVVVHPDPREPGRPVSVLLWPKESSQWEARRLALVFPEYAGWGWALSDVRSLLATVSYLQTVLARPLIDAPELVAHQLLSDLTRDFPLSSLRTSRVDPRTLTGSDGTPIPLLEQTRSLSWMRPLTVAEQRQRYLHKYRHCSWHLLAAMTVQLGTGEPQYSPTGRAYDGIRPGLWRINAEPVGSIFDGKRLPGCLDGEWMSTPQLNCCRDIGYRIQVREGWCWQESVDLLKRWASTLWQAAERLHTRPQGYRHAQARANAEHTVGLLAQLGVDLLARDEPSGGWSRPDWWAQVVGGGRAALFAQLVNLARKGTMPVVVVGDALWVVSDEASPLGAVPGLLTASRWRGYTAGYEVPLPLSREVKEAFRKAGDAGELARTLDALASEALLQGNDTRSLRG